MFGAELNEIFAEIGGIVAALFFLVMFILGVLMPLVIYLIYSNMYKSRQLLESIDQNLERLVTMASDHHPRPSGPVARNADGEA